MALSKLMTTTALLMAGSSTAFAGGLERSTFSSSILFEEGKTYIETVGAATLASVGSATSDLSALGGLPATPSANVTNNFSTINFGIKHDLTDKITLALTFNGQPLGADINYEGSILGTTLGFGNPANAPQGFVNSSEFNLLGRYKFNDNFSVYGGLRYQTVSAEADLSILAGLGAVAASQAAIFEEESGFGYIGGIAYEKKDIALRAALTYESEIEYDLTTNSAAGANLGTTNASAAEAWTLEFQSGVAPKTLVFGKVRYSKTGSANISVLGVPITQFSDTTTYTLGVGRKLSDKVSGSFSLFYENSDGQESGLFGPTDGLFGGSFGLSFDAGNGVKIGGGISHSKRGDTFSDVGPSRILFSDNSVTTIGVKISKTF